MGRKRMCQKISKEIVLLVKDENRKHPDLTCKELGMMLGGYSQKTVQRILNGEKDHLLNDNTNDDDHLFCPFADCKCKEGKCAIWMSNDKTCAFKQMAYYQYNIGVTG